MAYTQDDLEKINSALLDLSAGRRIDSVTLSTGKAIRYGQATLTELTNLKAIVEQSVNAKKKCRRIKTRTNKGL